MVVKSDGVIHLAADECLESCPLVQIAKGDTASKCLPRGGWSSHVGVRLGV